MGYELRFARLAERNFDAASAEVRAYLVRYLDALTSNPRPHDAVEVERGILRHQARNCVVCWVLVETAQPPLILVSVVLPY